MRLYNAGVINAMPKNGNVVKATVGRELEMRLSNKYYLESYHYVGNPRMVEKIKEEGYRIFLDSGAFSAMTMGINIDINRYCDYIHENKDIIEMASVLDAIGDSDQTWRNQDYMERQGINPLPCFHYGEPTDVLDYYVKNYEYITIGGMVPISTPQLKIWLDRLWAEHLTHSDGRPKVKVHGFGLTSLPLMMRYPWYSVDSSTWVMWAKSGAILLPDGRGRQLYISARSSTRKQKDMHVDNMAEIITETIERKIWDQGIDPERLRNMYEPRLAWNVWAFPELAHRKSWDDARFVQTNQFLF
jgi:hypothetical protein